MPIIVESKNYCIIVNKTPKVEFEMLTYSDNDYESDEGMDWVIDESNDIVYHCSAIPSLPLVEKEDPRVVIIPCLIGPFNVKSTLWNLGDRINLMLLFIYMLLGVGTLKLTSMKLLMADSFVKKPVGVLCNVEVSVESLIFLVDFMILDYEVDIQSQLYWVDPSYS